VGVYDVAYYVTRSIHLKIDRNLRNVDVSIKCRNNYGISPLSK